VQISFTDCQFTNRQFTNQSFAKSIEGDSYENCLQVRRADSRDVCGVGVWRFADDINQD
jgi:hypothetical protein